MPANASLKVRQKRVELRFGPLRRMSAGARIRSRTHSGGNRFPQARRMGILRTVRARLESRTSEAGHAPRAGCAETAFQAAHGPPEGFTVLWHRQHPRRRKDVSVQIRRDADRINAGGRRYKGGVPSRPVIKGTGTSRERVFTVGNRVALGASPLFPRQARHSGAGRSAN